MTRVNNNLHHVSIPVLDEVEESKTLSLCNSRKEEHTKAALTILYFRIASGSRGLRWAFDVSAEYESETDSSGWATSAVGRTVRTRRYGPTNMLWLLS